MITEYVLILGLFAFILGGVFFGDTGPKSIFEKSAPRLTARIEHHIWTGRGFVAEQKRALQWQKPNSQPPKEEL